MNSTCTKSVISTDNIILHAIGFDTQSINFSTIVTNKNNISINKLYVISDTST